MPKNIIICCDGTSNQFGNQNSNVVKLYSVIKKIPKKQIAYYDPGVGTDDSPGIGFRLKTWLKKQLGKATGYGLYNNVYEAYLFLMENYELGDKVFLFGFSRGAFTVRVLAGFILKMGLIEKGCQNQIPYAFHIYSKKKPNFELANRFKAQFSRECPIHFMGIWDTVSSIGYFGNWKTYPNTANNENIDVIRHALAIDERRAYYKQNSLGWKNNNIKEVWFAGVHADIGGSYPENESELSKITLQWILNEAHEQKLIIDIDKYNKVVLGNGKGFAKPNELGKIHNSLKWYWYWGEILPKTKINYSENITKWFIPLGRSRNILDGSWIHETALKRRKQLKKYNPLNIPKQFKTERTKENILKTKE